MPIPREYNQKYFERWSRDMAYVLGFLFADGNIVKTKRGTYFMAVYSADYGLMLSMRRSMRSSHKIGIRKTMTGKVYVMQIGSKNIMRI